MCAWTAGCVRAATRLACARSRRFLLLLMIALMADTGPAVLMQTSPPAGANLALNRPYTLDPAPNYPFSTDTDDKTQLTDGHLSSAPAVFWTQPSTVGWTNARPVVITIDLGSVQPIRGASFSTAGGRAGALWPAAI